jgi:hypothetical protein
MSIVFKSDSGVFDHVQADNVVQDFNVLSGRIDNMSGDIYQISGSLEGSTFGNSDLPESGLSLGLEGQTAYDTGHFYICVDQDTWRRVALSDFYRVEVEGGSASSN